MDGQKQVTIKNEDLELGTKLFEFEVKEMNAIAKDKINFDSKEQYEAKAGTQKYMSVEKYYLAKYHGAYYQVKPNFFLTPYFYELNLWKNFENILFFFRDAIINSIYIFSLCLQCFLYNFTS